MSNLPGCLSAFLRFFAGFFAGAVVAMVAWQIAYPPGGPNYGEGIGYGFAMMFWMLVGGIVCGLLTISSATTALSNKLTKGDEPDFKFNIVCFFLPLLFGLLPAVLIQDSEGLLGIIVCFLWALLALGAFLLRPKRKIKRALWSYLFGFAAAIAFFVIGSHMNLSEQQSPWLQ